MSKATSLLRAVERRMARRRRPGAVYIVASFEDDDHVTDRDGRRGAGNVRTGQHGG